LEVREMGCAVVHPRFPAAPEPALRLWIWLLSVGRYVGTPAGLHESVAATGAKVSRRTLPKAVAILAKAGMIRSRRRGHHIELEIVEATR
jgi:hypothetical protein